VRKGQGRLPAQVASGPRRARLRFPVSSLRVGPLRRGSLALAEGETPISACWARLVRQSRCEEADCPRVAPAVRVKAGERSCVECLTVVSRGGSARRHRRLFGWGARRVRGCGQPARCAGSHVSGWARVRCGRRRACLAATPGTPRRARAGPPPQPRGRRRTRRPDWGTSRPRRGMGRAPPAGTPIPAAATPGATGTARTGQSVSGAPAQNHHSGLPSPKREPDSAAALLR